MPFELEAFEPANDAVRRIALELVDRAIGGLEGGSEPAVAVHDARKACKRLRALLRMIRPQLSSRQFRESNARVRDAARLLAGSRDRTVVATTLSKLVATANDPSVYGQLQDDLTPATGSEADDASVQQAAAALRGIRDDLAALDVPDRGWKTFSKGLRKIYADGADAMDAAIRGGDDEAWHEWRKQVKHLWHGLELLQPTWPKVMSAMAAEVHALSDALGDEHDLQVLRAVMADEARGEAPPPSLLELLATRRDELQTAALHLGRRIYSDDPKSYARRLGSWYDVWQDEARRGAVGSAAP